MGCPPRVDILSFCFSARPPFPSISLSFYRSRGTGLSGTCDAPAFELHGCNNVGLRSLASCKMENLRALTPSA